MQINITLFIQIINFLITYWFLNKFLFNPVFDFINKKKNKEKRISKFVGKKEQDLLHLEEEKYQQLVEFRQDLRKKYFFEWKKKLKIPMLAKCELDEAEMKKMVEKVKDVLVQRILRVD